jgi:myo-inositol-1(or 4)-monophosphatase
MVDRISKLTLMEAVARAAGNMLVDMQIEATRLVSRKDFVSDADIKSENIILSALRSAFPEIPAFAEESGGEATKTGYLWVVDPIDGTVNYFFQDDHWGVSIALVKDRVTELGVVCLPKRNQLFSTGRGAEGSALVGLNRSLRVSSSSKMSDSQFWIGWGKESDGGRDHDKVCRVLRALDRVSLYPQIRNSATADLMQVAQGKIAGFVFLKPDPFDIAAAGLIVEMSGGKVTDLEGNPWGPFSGSLIASNGVLHDELLDTVRQAVREA